MFDHLFPRRAAVRSRLKRAGPLGAVVIAALVLVPSASSGNYGDPSGDSTNGAGDITSLTVSGDKASGQVVFRIGGSNIASSQQNVLFVDIDTDANPATGDLSGDEYSFYVDDSSFDFVHWNGSDWVPTPYSTVRVSGGTSGIMISVNRSELGNTNDFNFSATALNVAVNGTTATLGRDLAPDDGAYNYSFDANGPQIDSVDVQTTPSAGPHRGKLFVIAPTALHLPPDGRMNPTTITPESYSCTAKLGARTLTGTGTGGCTFAIPKKKARGKTLTVQLTVNYEGAVKVMPLKFKVG
jgi:hypothetical protein